MFDPSLDRLLAYRTGVISDCWGCRRAIRHGSRNHIWFLDPTELDEPVAPLDTDSDVQTTRERMLRAFAASGRFTATEISTLEALVVRQLSIGEIADRDGCSRQAVLARLVGNSRGQGGILKKAAAFHEAAGKADA